MAQSAGRARGPGLRLTAGPVKQPAARGHQNTGRMRRGTSGCGVERPQPKGLSRMHEEARQGVCGPEGASRSAGEPVMSQYGLGWQEPRRLE